MTVEIIYLQKPLVHLPVRYPLGMMVETLIPRNPSSTLRASVMKATAALEAQ